MVRQIEIAPGAVGVGVVHGLFGLRQVVPHVAASGDHISTQAESLAMHLLLQRVEAALYRGGAALKVIVLRLHVIEQLLLGERSGSFVLRLRIRSRSTGLHSGGVGIACSLVSRRTRSRFWYGRRSSVRRSNLPRLSARILSRRICGWRKSATLWRRTGLRARRTGCDGRGALVGHIDPGSSQHCQEKYPGNG